MVTTYLLVAGLCLLGLMIRTSYELLKKAGWLGTKSNLLAAGQGVELLLEDAPLFFNVVELALQTIDDRGGDHHDEELQRHEQHPQLPCLLTSAFPTLPIFEISWKNSGDDYSDCTGSTPEIIDQALRCPVGRPAGTPAK